MKATAMKTGVFATPDIKKVRKALRHVHDTPTTNHKNVAQAALSRIEDDLAQLHQDNHDLLEAIYDLRVYLDGAPISDIWDTLPRIDPDE